jgi:hypothetical protein
MAKVTLLGRDFEVAPLKLADLRKAAPALDRINSTAGSMSTLEGLIASMSDIAIVVSVALVKCDPEMTAQYIEENAGMPDLDALRIALETIMQESGMAPRAGEAPAPSKAAEGASTSSSEKSSTT